MNFCKNFKEKSIEIPESFDMTLKQCLDIEAGTENVFDMIQISFKFGYMQGIRASQAGKEGVNCDR